MLSPRRAWHMVGAQLLSYPRVLDNQPCLISAFYSLTTPSFTRLHFTERREEMGTVFAVGNSWSVVKGSQVAGLTFTFVQEAAPVVGCSHYQWLCPPVISRLHLATPGVPSSIIDHCLVSRPPSPTTSATRASLLISQFVHILKTI